MNIHRTVAAATIALSVLGIGAGQASAGDDSVAPRDPPPQSVGELVTPTEREESSTCEGNVNCRLLEGACDLVGGTYSGRESRDHGHTHGVCTWPWE